MYFPTPVVSFHSLSSHATRIFFFLFEWAEKRCNNLCWISRWKFHFWCSSHDRTSSWRLFFFHTPSWLLLKTILKTADFLNLLKTYLNWGDSIRKNQFSFVLLFVVEHVFIKSAGTGVVLCIEKALANSGVCRDDVNYINAHATSTQAGDLTEFQALIRCFGQNPEVTTWILVL